jgi:DNA-binding NtrC family response regulator
MQDAVRALDAAIRATGDVLVRGEPGSGRVLFARAIHYASANPPVGVEDSLRLAVLRTSDGRPFITVECAERDSIEDRLFGLPAADSHESGALDRISDDSQMFLSLGGTLVLCHVTEMPPSLQTRLGRILATGETLVKRSDGTELVSPLELRLVATAERTEALASELHSRLSQTVVTVPPLRARRDDIPDLVRTLVADLCVAAAVEPKAVSRQATDLLAALPWRGNVTELRALLKALVSGVPERRIRLRDVLTHVHLDSQASNGAYAGTLREARARFERDYVTSVLEQHRGRMGEAARALGLQRTNLYRKVRQLSVHRRVPGRRVA